MTFIHNTEQLEAIYGHAGETSTVKVTSTITPDYRAYIEASPFLTLATCGPEGLDCSPRGDTHGVVRVLDDKTLHLPDRRGNNRVDSLRNIIRDPRVAMLFLLPGSGSTLRVNGRAKVSVDVELLESFKVDRSAPRSVVVIKVDEVYFQCARAIVRSELWNPKRFIAADSLPTPGQILANLTDDRVGGPAYDRDWPERARKTLW